MRLVRPRFTIERLRTLVLVGGLVLVVAIAIFLAAGQWKLRRLARDLPGRLGADIQVRSNGVDYTQTRKGKTLFKMHAARAVQMKKDGKTLLHDVKIDLYGEDGSRTDTISGSEFEYDPGAGVAEAAGEVEITLMRPGVRPAVAQMVPGASKPLPPSPSAKHAEELGDDNQIHVKTSGLLFNQKTGLATTSKRVDFELQQGSGSSTGASYDSSRGLLILDKDVALNVIHGSQSSSSGPVIVHAAHAQFERTHQSCELIKAHAVYTNGTVNTGNALIHFREDGSVIQLDGSGGVDLDSKNGSHVTAPTGHLEFDEENHPQHGILTGGAHLDVAQASRQTQGSAPTIQLEFNHAGLLHSAHLERGVVFQSQQETTSKGSPVKLIRTWKSQKADLTFAPAATLAAGGKGEAREAKNGKSSGKVEPSVIRGNGGVVLTSRVLEGGTQTLQSREAGPSSLSADVVVADLAPGGVLTSLSGTGHAVFDDVTAQGVHQSGSSDQLDVKFNPGNTSHPGALSKSKDVGDTLQVSTVTQTGHVVLTQDQSSTTGSAVKNGQGAKFAASSPVRVTAARSDYDGQTQVLHLSGSPRLRDGALDMTSHLLDFNRATGDAFAHGDVKASWLSQAGESAELPGASLLASGNGETGSQSSEPVHAVAAEAELRQATQEVVFHGGNGSAKGTPGEHQAYGAAGNLPRMWQGSNSIAAPVITLNRQKQTLTAWTSNAATPVLTVLVSNVSSRPAGSRSVSPRSNPPSVIRMRSGDLHYSEGERLATLHSGSLGGVWAETNGPDGAAKVTSQEAEVHLLAAGVHSGSAPQGDTKALHTGGSGRAPGSASIDRLIALGHVSVDWPDRKGTGEKLVYTSEEGNFTLTGTAAAPPRITDQARGTVTGTILIFHSGDDSVTVEGDGGKTITETQAPKRRAPSH